MANKLTQFLAQEESSGGRNIKARTPDIDQALGTFQLTPGLYADIQKNFPEFKDVPFERAALEAGLDKQVANAGIQTIQKQIAGIGIAPTPALISTVWQQGIGNIQKAARKSLKTGSPLSEHLGPLGQRRLERATRALPSPQEKQQDFGLRVDGTRKGEGFLGVLKRPGGGVSTELSIGVSLNGQETEIPTLIPTLSTEERDFLLQGNKPSKAIVRKAVSHARMRRAQGLSPFK